MGIPYNKTKDRRIITTGPRDHQLRHSLGLVKSDQSSLIEELRSQIKVLTDRLEQKPVFTNEQVNNEISNAIKEETAFLKEKFASEISLLKEEIVNLKRIIDNKNKFIEELISGESNTMNKLSSKLAELVNTGNHVSTYCESVDRPAMNTVFVDPIDKAIEVETHIDIKEISSTVKKKDLDEKTKKLRNILGKLPDKKT